MKNFLLLPIALVVGLAGCQKASTVGLLNDVSTAGQLFCSTPSGVVGIVDGVTGQAWQVTGQSAQVVSDVCKLVYPTAIPVNTPAVPSSVPSVTVALAHNM